MKHEIAAVTYLSQSVMAMLGTSVTGLLVTSVTICDVSIVMPVMVCRSKIWVAEISP